MSFKININEKLLSQINNNLYLNYHNASKFLNIIIKNY